MVMHNKTKTIAISLLSILFLAILVVPSVYADESIVDVVTINVPVSCSMSATGTDSHTANVNNGQTTENIGTTNLKVICNDNSGYAIYAIGYTDDTYGKTVLTSSTLGSTHDIATATTVTTGTSSWAMKLTAQTGIYAPIIAGSNGDSLRQTGDPDFSDYTAVPSTYTKVAYYTSSTDTGNNATGSNLTTTYRAYISPSQPAGTYIGQVKYTLVHPNMNDDSNKPVAPLRAEDCPASSVCFAPNADDVVGDMSSIGTIAASSKAGKNNAQLNSSTQLISPNYYRPGYGFAGWSTEYDATIADNPTIYGPNEWVSTRPATGGVDISNNGFILYPVWIESTGSLQEWNGCNTLTAAPADGSRATLSSVTALTDERDGNVYTVARLADGKCWMIENLRLNAENSVGISNIAKAQGYAQSTTYGNFIGLPDSEDDFYASGTAINSLYSSNGSTLVNIGSNHFPSYRIPRYNNNNINIGGKNASGTDLIASHNGNSNTAYQWYSYGNFYSWPAAVADTSFQESNSGSITNTSICPLGWRLPTGGETPNSPASDFWELTVNRLMGGVQPEVANGSVHYYDSTNGREASDKLKTFPNNFVYAGFHSGSYTQRRYSEGWYWTSSYMGGNYNFSSYGFNIYGYIVYPGNIIESRDHGYSVRCIAQ